MSILSVPPPTPGESTPSPLPGFAHGRYAVRFANGPDDLEAALRLRFQVFNVELGEGLESSWATGRDEDRFDGQCDHLLVDDLDTGSVIGTYRMQTCERALAADGFYSSGEFDLDRLPRDLLCASVEVGRACIARERRNGQVLFLLWRGLASYLKAHRKRFLFGCSSLTTQDPAVGLAAFADLTAAGHLHPEWSALPLPGLECEAGASEVRDAGPVRLPILFQTYLRHGARILGPPAIDREFKTIDFLTLLDTQALAPDVAARFFGPPRGHGR